MDVFFQNVMSIFTVVFVNRKKISGEFSPEAFLEVFCAVTILITLCFLIGFKKSPIGWKCLVYSFSNATHNERWDNITINS